MRSNQEIYSVNGQILDTLTLQEAQNCIANFTSTIQKLVLIIKDHSNPEQTPPDVKEHTCLTCCCPINDRSYKTAMGFNFHSDCFKCFSCEITLEKYLPLHGKPLCLSCFEKNSEQSVCGICNKTLGQTEPIFHALNQKFHPECFVCSVCKCRFMDGHYNFINESPLCNKCLVVRKKCIGCERLILEKPGGYFDDEEPDFVETKYGFWHSSCFQTLATWLKMGCSFFQFLFFFSKIGFICE